MKLVKSLFTAAFIIVAAGCTATTSDSGDAASTGDTGSGGGDTGSGGGDTGSGGDTATTDSGTGSETSSETGGATCKDCAAAHCKSESDACGADPKCVDGVVCLAKCQASDAGASDKSACENTCITNASNDHLNAYVACLASNCKDPCGL